MACNKENCNITLDFPRLSEDMINYYKLHHAKVERLPDRSYRLIIPLSKGD